MASIMDDSRCWMSVIAFRTAPPVGGFLVTINIAYEWKADMTGTAEAEVLSSSYNVWWPRGILPTVQISLTDFAQPPASIETRLPLPVLLPCDELLE